MSPTATERSPESRMVGFLVVSVLLHLLWLAIPLHPRTSSEFAGMPAALTAHLLPRLDRAIQPARTEPAQKSAVVVRHAEPSAVMSVPASPASEVTIAPATATIDLDVARATARAYAREPQPRTTLDAPKPLLTVEAAVARATEPDFVIETRGPAGERIIQTRDTRCVMPLVVPNFMQGVTVLALCEKRKK